MESTMSRLLIETTVRQTLKSLQQDPKRSIRNLVDMALQFSEGRFQSSFFEVAHTMLKDQDSAYYALVQDAASHIETEHLVRFGMNLGYNSCTWGAKRIRSNEAALGFNIPWAILLEMGEADTPERMDAFNGAITDGEELGVYTWMLFCAGADPSGVFPLVQQHPDSAFFLFCPSSVVTDALIEKAFPLCNLMLVLRWDGASGGACSRLRRARLPYSVCLPYSQADAAAIESGETLLAIQQRHPIFTVLMPRPGCPAEAHTAVYEFAVEARKKQIYRTVPWDIYYDTCRLDRIISDDPCWVCFDGEGDLYFPGAKAKEHSGNLFRDGLSAVIRQAYPKLTGVRPH